MTENAREPGQPSSAVIHLATDDVSVLLDVTDGRLPQVVHWGARLERLTADLATDLIRGAIPVVGPNAVDVPVRVAILPEHHTGFVGRPGLSGFRDGRAWSPKFVTDHIRVGQGGSQGEEIAGWLETGPAIVEVSATDDETGLAIALTIELLPSGLLRTRAELTNLADPYTVDDLVLSLPVPAQASELLDLAGRWGRERAPQRRDFTVGTHLREGRKGRTGADAATVLHAGATGFGFAHGEVWGVHTAWSGNHTHYAELTFDGSRRLGGGELLLPGEVRLERGESYRTPWLYGAYGVGLDAVAHRFHRHLRSRPTHVDTARPVTLNVWEAVYFDHDAERLIDLAERAAALGVERFVLDDGWFGSRRDDSSGLGDWVVSTDIWPDGLHPLIDRVSALGMQFGLWFEPEMVNPDSELARAHPEWILSAREQWPVESRFQQVLHLGIPECYQHIRDQIRALLDEYAIGYIKWDHNRDLIEAGDQTQGGRPGVHAQTEAVYRLLAELKAAKPGLEIESCSSGGARVDLGILEHTDRVWVSDNIDPLERQQMMRWTQQLIPPELLGSHIASGRSHTTGRNHDLNFRALTAVFGHLGIEWDLAKASPEELNELGDWITFYKEHRDFLFTGDVVRMDEPGDGFLIHGVVAPDRSRGLFAVVLIANPLAEPGPRIRLRGLDPERVYRIRPRLIGAAPSGLRPPQWWGGGASGRVPRMGAAPPRARMDYPGVAITGGALASVGLAMHRIHPDQGVLFEIAALD